MAVFSSQKDILKSDLLVCSVAAVLSFAVSASTVFLSLRVRILPRSPPHQGLVEPEEAEGRVRGLRGVCPLRLGPHRRFGSWLPAFSSPIGGRVDAGQQPPCGLQHREDSSNGTG